jgi:hypothetical protein
MLPAIFFVFLTKCKFLLTKLTSTTISLWAPLTDLHLIHASLGRSIGTMTAVHLVAHGLRWGLRTELRHFYGHTCGISGTLAILALFAVSLPMAVPCLRDRIRWEYRKLAHVLGALLFCVVMVFHTSFLRNFIMTVMGIYLLDWAACESAMTHKVSHTLFRRQESGTQITFENPCGW